MKIIERLLRGIELIILIGAFIIWTYNFINYVKWDQLPDKTSIGIAFFMTAYTFLTSSLDSFKNQTK